MRLLLDTHTLLWLLVNDSKLSVRSRKTIEDPANNSFVSIVSLWEIALKTGMGKLTLPAPFSAVFPAELVQNGIGVMNVELPHLGAMLQLPSLHRDPFDRLLVAQAIVEGMTLVTSDAQLANYPVPVLW
jgi:PIN domain nuclease of toxin-antitoxin system